MRLLDLFGSGESFIFLYSLAFLGLYYSKRSLGWKNIQTKTSRNEWWNHAPLWPFKYLSLSSRENHQTGARKYKLTVAAPFLLNMSTAVVEETSNLISLPLLKNTDTWSYSCESLTILINVNLFLILDSEIDVINVVFCKICSGGTLSGNKSITNSQ